jgi:hypothetical protein
MRAIVVSLIVACVAGVGISQSTDSADRKTPILVELFTSEGCSSCPPRDLWLQQMDALQPVSGAQIIVLSEHVDYFNGEGWKDPYSLPIWTDRQSSYARSLRLNSTYTPQVIVNGKNVLLFSEPQQVEQVLVEASSAPHITMNISALSVETRVPPLLRIHIDVSGEHVVRNADIFAAVALDHAESQVARGENGGKHLTHVAVAQQILKVGKVAQGKVFSKDLQIKLRSAIDPQNLRLVVFVQEPDYGRVIGATQIKSGPSGK